MAVGQNKEIQNSPGRTSRGFWVSHKHMRFPHTSTPSEANWNIVSVEIFLLLTSSSFPPVSWHFLPSVIVSYRLQIWILDFWCWLFRCHFAFLQPCFKADSCFPNTGCFFRPRAILCPSLYLQLLQSVFYLWNLIRPSCITVWESPAFISGVGGMVSIRKLCIPPGLHALAFSVPAHFSLLPSLAVACLVKA